MATRKRPTTSLDPSNPPTLTKKQAAFRDAIIGGYKPSVAYSMAYEPKKMGPRLITIQAQKVLKHPKVRLAISLAIQSGQRSTVLPALSPNVALSMQRRLDELSCAAILDPVDAFDELNHIRSIRDMPEHVRRAIAGFEVDPVSFVTKIKFIDKRGAIMDYSKLAGDIPREETAAPAPSAQYDHTKLTKEEWEQSKAIKRKALVGPSVEG